MRWPWSRPSDGAVKFDCGANTFYLAETHDPPDVLHRLDAKIQHFEPGEMATVLYAVVDPRIRFK